MTTPVRCFGVFTKKGSGCSRPLARGEIPALLKFLMVRLKLADFGKKSSSGLPLDRLEASPPPSRSLRRTSLTCTRTILRLPVLCESTNHPRTRQPTALSWRRKSTRRATESPSRDAIVRPQGEKHGDSLDSEGDSAMRGNHPQTIHARLTSHPLFDAHALRLRFNRLRVAGDGRRRDTCASRGFRGFAKRLVVRRRCATLTRAYSQP